MDFSEILLILGFISGAFFLLASIANIVFFILISWNRVFQLIFKISIFIAYSSIMVLAITLLRKNADISWGYYILGFIFIFLILWDIIRRTYFQDSIALLAGLFSYILFVISPNLIWNNITVEFTKWIFKMSRNPLAQLVGIGILIKIIFETKKWIGYLLAEPLKDEGRWICPSCGKIKEYKYDICSNCRQDIENVT